MGGKRCTAKDFVLFLLRRQPEQLGLLSPSNGSSLVKARKHSSSVRAVCVSCGHQIAEAAAAATTATAAATAAAVMTTNMDLGAKAND